MIKPELANSVLDSRKWVKCQMLPFLNDIRHTCRILLYFINFTRSSFLQSRAALRCTADGGVQSVFPAGTVEIYAFWDYLGMPLTGNIRRIWFRDDQIYLTGEEGLALIESD